MPPGTRLMKEEERISTLEELKKNRADVNDMLMAMPLSMRTDALRNKKRELEDKLSDIEKAIGTFSRKVVYIAETKWMYDVYGRIYNSSIVIT